MGPVLKWVDDFLFFRYPPFSHTEAPTYTIDDIYHLATSLGWPWKEAKTKPFSELFVYLGFEWNIPARTVHIPLGKRQKYALRVEAWSSSQAVSLHDTEAMIGSLIHCTQVIPEGRPHLAGLIAFAASFSHLPQHRFQTRVHSMRSHADALWWLDVLRNGHCTRLLRHPFPLLEEPIFMDASTSYGIGVIVAGHVMSWRLAKGWRRPGFDIGWAEMAAVELALAVLIRRGVRNRSVSFRSDNNGVVFALQAGRSRNPHQNAILMRILATAEAHGIDINISYIRSAENPADGPSRGVSPPNTPAVDWPCSVPSDLIPFLA